MQEETTGTSGKVVPGTKVLREKVNEGAVDEALKALDVSVPKGATVEKKVAALAKEFSDPKKKYDLAKCDVCGGVSDAEKFADCPFCGHGDDAPAEAAADEPEPSADDVGDEEAPAEEEAPPESTEITTPGEMLDAAKPEEGEAAKPEKKSRAKKPKAEKPAKEEKAGPTVVKRDGSSAHVNGASNGIAKHGTDVLAAGSEKKLDAAVKKIHQLAENADRSSYEIGKEMHGIYKPMLWKARRNENGDVAYKTWEQFVRTELNFEMTLRYSFLLMQVVENITEEDVNRIGITKAKLIVAAPAALQPKLLEAAKAGASTKDISAKVKAANKKRKPEPGSKANKTKREPTSATITLAALTPSKHRVPLYTRATFGKEKAVPAKRLGDQPVGVLDLANDVQARISVFQSKAGVLFAQVDFVRPKD